MFERRTKRVTIDTASHRMVGILDYPEGNPLGTAVYAPCFTCGKDLKAAARICRGLAEQGVAVLRFDFPGIGESSGEFEQTNFSQNREDAVAATRYLISEFGSAQLLIGHSLGGAAMLSVASKIDSVRGVVALAAPSDTKHLADHLEGRDPRIRSEGKGQVNIGGRDFVIRPHLTDDLRAYDLEADIRQLNKPLLVMHSPIDETLGYHHAERIFQWAPQPKSLITLDQADHLFVKNPADVDFIAGQIFVWANRYVFE